MTDNKHPITPPPELVKQWLEEYYGFRRTGEVNAVEQHLVTRAARWGADQELDLDAEQINQAWQKGADQELEMCCEWLASQPLSMRKIPDLRSFRRPKPPSLKKQAFDALDTYIYGNPDHNDKEQTYNTIRRALEQLDD